MEPSSPTHSDPSINEDSQSQSTHLSLSTYPNKAAVFFSQIFIIFIVVLAAVINLSIPSGQRTELWVCLISTSLGAILPSPKLKYYNKKFSQPEKFNPRINP